MELDTVSHANHGAPVASPAQRIPLRKAMCRGVAVEDGLSIVFPNDLLGLFMSTGRASRQTSRIKTAYFDAAPAACRGLKAQGERVSEPRFFEGFQRFVFSI